MSAVLPGRTYHFPYCSQHWIAGFAKKPRHFVQLQLAQRPALSQVSVSHDQRPIIIASDKCSAEPLSLMREPATESASLVR